MFVLDVCEVLGLASRHQGEPMTTTDTIAAVLAFSTFIPALYLAMVL